MTTTTTTTTCPTCKGTGKGTLRIGSMGHTMPIDCLTCNGTGQATTEQINALNRFNAMWCRCGNPTYGKTYHQTDDGHHWWTCDDCGKIAQLG